MPKHEEFLELCAAATAGELSAQEQEKLSAHLAECPDCRTAFKEYELSAQQAVSAMASEFVPEETAHDSTWSIEDAEKRLFQRIESESYSRAEGRNRYEKQGQRFTYRPTQFRFRELWMSIAAVVILALALGIVAYR